MSQSSLPPSPNQNTPGHPVTLDATKPPLSGHGSVARRAHSTPTTRRRAAVKTGPASAASAAASAGPRPAASTTPAWFPGATVARRASPTDGDAVSDSATAGRGWGQDHVSRPRDPRRLRHGWLRRRGAVEAARAASPPTRRRRRESWPAALPPPAGGSVVPAGLPRGLQLLLRLLAWPSWPPPAAPPFARSWSTESQPGWRTCAASASRGFG